MTDTYSSEKPAFDPSQPFEAVGGGKPPFDPSKPFEAAPVERPSMLQKAAEPITSYPATYGEMNRDARERLSQGFTQSGEALAEPHSGAGAVKFAKGVGNMALGGLEYVASPINAALRTVVGKPIEENLGVPKEYTEFAGALALPGVGMTRMPRLPVRAAPTKPAVPTAEALKAEAKSVYQSPEVKGIEIEPQKLSDLADDIVKTLRDDGYRPLTAPKTLGLAQELKVDGSTAAVADVEAVRRALNKAAADPAERDAARKAIEKIDEFTSGLTPELADARGNYAAAKRSEKIDSAIERAQLNAASAGSGANIDNATRQAIKSILRSPKELRGFSADEIVDMRKIVTGTFTGNAARLLGKLAPTGVVSTALSGGAGFAAGGGIGAVALPTIGYAGKKLADVLTTNQLARLDATIRSRSPLAKTVGAPLEVWSTASEALTSAPTVPNLVKFQLASTNLINNLKDIGISLSPADLLRAIQITPSRAPALQSIGVGRTEQDNPDIPRPPGQ